MERALGVISKVLELEDRTRTLKTVTLCLLMYPSDESQAIIEAVLNG
jgi:hypothetical protein